ncbi:hypothetical protein [Streptomyces sp. NPDC020489]|uniref:hypothetical protein n=1 Tax=Streptomyces sp. NPDC020489 TaxID=3365077 RepID=UPI00379A0DEB
MTSEQPTTPGARPRVGDTVHYVSHGTPPRADGSQAFTSQCRAAIVTAVLDGALPLADTVQTEAWDSNVLVAALAVLNPEGAFFNRVPRSEHDYRGGTWHSRDTCPN